MDINIGPAEQGCGWVDGMGGGRAGEGEREWGGGWINLHTDTLEYIAVATWYSYHAAETFMERW